MEMKARQKPKQGSNTGQNAGQILVKTLWSNAPPVDAADDEAEHGDEGAAEGVEVLRRRVRAGVDDEEGVGRRGTH